MRLCHPPAIHYVASIGFVTGVFLFQIDLPLVAAVLVWLLDVACNVDQLEVAFRILTFLLTLVLEEEAVEVGQVDGLCPGPLESLLERGEDGAGLLNSGRFQALLLVRDETKGRGGKKNISTEL